MGRRGGSAARIRCGEPALAAVSGDQRNDQRQDSGVDAALGVPDQYFARTVGGGSGSGGCVERRPHRRGGPGRVVGRAAGGGQSTAFRAQLPGDPAHRVGHEGGSLAPVGPGSGEYRRVFGRQAAECGGVKTRWGRVSVLVYGAVTTRCSDPRSWNSWVRANSKAPLQRTFAGRKTPTPFDWTRRPWT